MLNHAPPPFRLRFCFLCENCNAYDDWNETTEHQWPELFNDIKQFFMLGFSVHIFNFFLGVVIKAAFGDLLLVSVGPFPPQIVAAVAESRPASPFQLCWSSLQHLAEDGCLVAI